jgi:O-antigen/teichoic acid export membrane protein
VIAQTPPDAAPQAKARTRNARVLKNAVALAIAQCFTWAASSFLILLMPKYLGDADLGRYVTALFFVSLLALLADCGMGMHVVKATAQAEGRGQISHLTLNALMARLPLVLVSTGLGIAMVNLLFSGSLTRSIFYVLLPGFVLQMICNSLSASLRGLQEMRPVALGESLNKVAQTMLMILLMVRGYSVVTVAAVSVVGPALALAIMALSLRRRISLTFRIDLLLWRSLLFGGLPFLLWHTALLTYGQVDLVFLAKLTSDEVVGWYAAAYRLVAIPAFLPGIVTAALFPALSSVARYDTQAVKGMAWAAVRIVFFATLPMGLGIALLPDRIIEFLGYPEAFRNSVPLMTILALHMPVVSVTMVIGICLISLDKQWQWVAAGVAAALLNPALNLLLIPLTQSAYENGAIGAAVATGLTELLMLAFGLCLLPRGLVDMKGVLDVLRLLAAGLVMSAVVWFLRDVELLAVPVLAGAAIYLALAWLMGALPLRQMLNLIRNRTAQPDDAERM